MVYDLWDFVVTLLVFVVGYGCWLVVSGVLFAFSCTFSLFDWCMLFSFFVLLVFFFVV